MAVNLMHLGRTGRFLKKALPIAAGIVAIIDPAIAIAMAALHAGISMTDSERAARNRNTALDVELANQEAGEQRAIDALIAQQKTELQQQYQDLINKLRSVHTLEHNTYAGLKAHLERRGSNIARLDNIIELLQACIDGDDKAVMAGYAEFQQDLDFIAEWGLLHILMLSKDFKMLQTIYTECMDVSDLLHNDFLGHSLLEYALLVGHRNFSFNVKHLITAAKASALQKYAQKVTEIYLLDIRFVDGSQLPLVEAVLDKDIEMVQALCLLGHSPHQQDSNGLSAFRAILDLPIAEGYPLCKALVENCIAIYGGSVEENVSHTVQVCEATGAVQTVVENYPLPQSVHQNYQLLFKVSFWCRYNTGTTNAFSFDVYGHLPLVDAVRQANIEIIEAMLDLKVDINQREASFAQDTAIITAVSMQNPTLLHLLLNNGADPWIENAHGENAFTLATPDMAAIIQLLADELDHAQYGATDDDAQALNMVRRRQLIEQFRSTEDLIAKAGLAQALIDLDPTLHRTYKNNVIFGQYLQGLEQIVPLDHMELPYIAKMLNLSVALIYKKNDKWTTKVEGPTNTKQLVVWHLDTGYKAFYNGVDIPLQHLSSQPQSAKSHLFDLRLPSNTNTTAQEYIFSCLNLFNKDIKASYSTIKAAHNIDGMYVFPMPNLDAGYHALGINRATAAQQLLDHLDVNEVYELLMDVAYSANYASIEGYIADYIATPGNALNQMRLQVMQALAIINNLHINLSCLVAGELQQLPSTNINIESKVIDILIPENNVDTLERIAILHADAEHTVPLVATHLDVMPKTTIDSDYDAVMHGWAQYRSNNLGVVPQDDLLAMLLQCHGVINKLEYTETEFLAQIYNARLELQATMLSEKDLAAVQRMAHSKSKELARCTLLYRHSAQLMHYAENLDAYKTMLSANLQARLADLEQQTQQLETLQGQQFNQAEQWRQDLERKINAHHTDAARIIAREFDAARQMEHIKTSHMRREGRVNATLNFVAFTLTAAIPQIGIESAAISAAITAGSRTAITSRGNLKEIAKSAATGAILGGFGELGNGITLVDSELINAVAKGAIEGMAETALFGGNRQDILAAAGFGALRGAAALQVNSKVAISDARVKAAVSGTVQNIIRGCQHGTYSFDGLLGYALEGAGYAVAYQIRHMRNTLMQPNILDDVLAQGLASLPARDAGLNFNLAANDSLSTESEVTESVAQVAPKVPAIAAVSSVVAQNSTSPGVAVPYAGTPALAVNTAPKSVAANPILDFFFTPAYAEDIASESTQHQAKHPSANYVEEGYVSKAVIGTGRSMVYLYQGAKQLALAGSEKLGLVEQGTTNNYTRAVQYETHVYKNSAVGQSTTAKVAEVVTDVATCIVLPGGSGARGLRLVAEVGASSAVFGAAQVTEDGKLSSHGINAAKFGAYGVIGGAALGKVSQQSSRAITYLMDSYNYSRSLAANPFKGLSFSQIAEKLKAKGYSTKGRDPLNRAGAFFHPRTNRKYYLDHGGQYKRSYEHAHVDVHYSSPQVGTNIEKRKYPLGNKLYEKSKNGIN